MSFLFLNIMYSFYLSKKHNTQATGNRGIAYHINKMMDLPGTINTDTNKKYLQFPTH